MTHRENKKKNAGTNPFFCGEDTKRITTAFNSTSGIPQNILEFSDSANFTHPAGCSNSETKGTEQPEKSTPAFNNLLSKAIADKLNQLGLDELSHIQTKMVKQAVLANYKPTSREWAREPSREYLEMIGSQDYKDVYNAIKKALANGQSYIAIDQRYALPSHVAAYDLSIDILLSKQDMKAGKSYAHGWMIANHPAFRINTGTPNSKSVCHLESISIANATARNADSDKYDWGVVHADYQAKDFNNVDNVLTSINSEKSNKKKALFTNLDSLLMDETEGMGGFIISDSLPNKWSAIESLRETIDNTDFVVFTDAHAGGVTDRFIQLLTDKTVFTIKNEAMIWEHVNGYKIDGQAQGVKENVKQLRGATKKNNAIGSFFANADECASVHRKISKKLNLTTEQYPLITSKTGADELVRNLKQNPKLFKKLVGFCASPSLGIGISIEVKKFKTAFLFISDSDNVGDSHSQLQMPFRLREILSLIVVKCPVEKMVAKRDILRKELIGIVTKKAQAEFILENTIDNTEIQAVIANERLSAQKDIYAYSMDMRIEFIADCLKRFENIEQGLIEKGIDLINIDVELSEFEEKESALIKAEIKREVLARRATTPIISADEAKAIVGEKRKNNNRMSESDTDKLTVYTVAKNFLPAESDLRTVPVEAIRAYEKGAVSKRDRLQAAITPKRHINKIAKAHAYGVKDGNKTRLKADLADLSPEKMLIDYGYDKYLASLLDISKDENGYVLKIGGSINLDNAHGRTKKKVVQVLNDFIDQRNALKTNGNLESKITGKNISEQIKNKISNRMGVKFKASKKSPAIIVERKLVPPSYLLSVLVAVFGKDENKIRANQVAAENILQSGMIDLLTDNVRKKVNKDSRYKITKANAKKQPLRALKRLLEVAGIDHKKTNVSNGYQVENSGYDSQYLADIAREKNHNEIAEKVAYIDSIGMVKN
jgi:hypothetical protein